MVAIALRTKESETTMRVNDVIKMRIAGARVRIVNKINICRAAAISPGFSIKFKPNSVMEMAAPHLSQPALPFYQLL